jgi:hypothetical protein
MKSINKLLLLFVLMLTIKTADAQFIGTGTQTNIITINECRQ